MGFRRITTSSGKLVLAGKSAANNEELVEQIGVNEDVFHTVKPGSPFVNIKGRSNKEDRKEAAIFCAKYSQDWRDHQSDIAIHWFKGASVEKKKGMEIGTFSVKKFKLMKIKKEDIEKWKK